MFTKASRLFALVALFFTLAYARGATAQSVRVSTAPDMIVSLFAQGEDPIILTGLLDTAVCPRDDGQTEGRCFEGREIELYSAGSESDVTVSYSNPAVWGDGRVVHLLLSQRYILRDLELRSYNTETPSTSSCTFEDRATGGLITLAPRMYGDNLNEVIEVCEALIKLTS